MKKLIPRATATHTRDDLVAKRADIEHRIGKLITELNPLRKELADAQVALRDIDRELVRSLSDDELAHNITRLERSTSRENQPFKGLGPRSPAERDVWRKWIEQRDQERRELDILATESANRSRKATIAAKKKAREQAASDAKFTKELELEPKRK